MAIPDEKIRRKAIEDALTATQADPDHDRVRLPWEGGRPAFVKIRLSLDMVVLNPTSYRIQSQIESLPDDKQNIIKADPFGEDAQALIAQIIAETPGFEDVLAEMEDVGQEDPGVVMRSGVLINANTRVVALRKINPQGYVDLLVLPPSPDPKSVARLEWDLQEKRDIKQPYTFTNSLLQLERMKKFGYSDSDAAKALRVHKDPKKAVEDIAERTRSLATIREIQKRSGGVIKLTFFDDLVVALQEMDRAYLALKKTDLAGAEKIREAKILGILTNVGYEKVRRFNSPERVDNLLVSALTDPGIVEGALRDAVEKALEPTNGNGTPLPGLAQLADPDEEDNGANLKALVDVVATNVGNDTIKLPSDNGDVETNWDELRNTVAEAIDYAAEDAKAQDDAHRSLTGPSTQLREARKRTDLALAAYRKVAKDPKFKTSKFDYDLRKLRQAVDAVQQELQKNSVKP